MRGWGWSCNFFENETETFFLYWWHRLDEEGFVHFTLCILDKFQRANAKYFALVSNQHTNTVGLKRGNDVKVDIAKNMAMVYTTHIQSVCHQEWKYINNVVWSVLCRVSYIDSQLAIANLKLNITLSRSCTFCTFYSLNNSTVVLSHLIIVVFHFVYCLLESHTCFLPSSSIFWNHQVYQGSRSSYHQ